MSLCRTRSSNGDNHASISDLSSTVVLLISCVVIIIVFVETVLVIVEKAGGVKRVIESL